MIRLENVSKKYGDQLAVDSVSLSVNSGEKHVLIGTSGSGKTTLLKMINKIIPKSSGDIFVNDINTDQWQDYLLRRKLGYVIQQIGLFPHYTIRQNISLVPGILKWPDSRVKERTFELISMVGLPERMLDMYPDSLSGGQQQRVGIARALAADPEILLMDEPFGALDPITRAGMQQEFIQLPGIENKTVVLVTHDMMEAALLGDKITVLNKGKVCQSSSLAGLLFRPDSEFVSEFLENQREQLEWLAIPVRMVADQLPLAETDGDYPVVSSSLRLSQLPANGRFLVNESGHKYLATRDECLSLYYQNREEIRTKMSADV